VYKYEFLQRLSILARQYESKTDEFSEAIKNFIVMFGVPS